MATYRREILRYLEAGIIGLFFVGAMRFLYATLYAHFGSLDQLTKTVNRAALAGVAGVVSRSDVQTEIAVSVIGLLLPLLAIALGRWRFGTLAALVAAAGRVYMTAGGSGLIGVIGAALTVGGGLLYAAVIAGRRPAAFPVMFIVGFAGDQLIRLYGESADPTWAGSFLQWQVVISLAVFGIVLINLALDAADRRREDYETPMPTQISGWGALAMGGLLYVEFTLFGLSNTLAHRAGVENAAIAPWLVGATLLPLVPEVRDLARRFLGMFDGQWRGWVWLLLTGLLTVIGFRFSGTIVATVLVVAQLLIGLSWWWVSGPTEGRGGFSGAGVCIAVALFLALTGADYFTYDYAFVFGVQEPFGTGLRALRGMGLAIVLLAIVFINLPAILARMRLPWRGGRLIESMAGLLLAILAGGLAVALTQPIPVIGSTATDRMRVATLNMHGGYSLYFDSNLPALANEIARNGADVVLLQEVETGRLESGGVDQAEWLAHTLKMEVLFFPTNEALQGLAILTRLPILSVQNVPLSSLGKQTGVQFARLRTPEGGGLDVYNTELGFLLRENAQSISAQEQDQTTQLSEIYTLIGQNDPDPKTRVVIGGTFNNTPASDLYGHMAAAFVDPFAGIAQEKTLTWRLVNNVTSRVDYLWLRGITPLSAAVADLSESTHGMAVVEIALK